MLGIDPRAARVTWTVILTALLCLVIYTIRHTFFIFIVSLLFAYLLAPIVDLIDRVLPLRRSRTPALAIVYLALVAGIVVTGVAVGTRVAEQANNLAHNISEFLKPEQTCQLPLPQPLKPIGAQIVSVLRKAIEDHYQEILQTLPQAVMNGVGAAASLVLIVIAPLLR